MWSRGQVPGPGLTLSGLRESHGPSAAMNPSPSGPGSRMWSTPSGQSDTARTAPVAPTPARPAARPGSQSERGTGEGHAALVGRGMLSIRCRAALIEIFGRHPMRVKVRVRVRVRAAPTEILGMLSPHCANPPFRTRAQSPDPTLGYLGTMFRGKGRSATRSSSPTSPSVVAAGRWALKSDGSSLIRTRIQGGPRGDGGDPTSLPSFCDFPFLFPGMLGIR